MASLPPRPKSPPIVDTRDRERGRDRGEPKASRLRDERGERPARPARPSDTYIPSYRRDGDGRHEYDDRDRERYRDIERRDRHHRRDRSPPPPPRRRESPTRDRDRRPPYRNTTRRHPSPRRGPPFRSRSRSPRRSSPRRYRSRSRSRSHSPRRSPKFPRHRQSRSRSPAGARSPFKNRHSSRSRSPGHQPRSGHGEGDPQTDISKKALVPLVREEKTEANCPGQSVVKQEERSPEITSQLAETQLTATLSRTSHSPTHSFVKTEPLIEPPEGFASQTAEEVEHNSTNQSTNMDEPTHMKTAFDSPTILPSQPQSSQTDPRTPLEDFPNRLLPSAPRTRSPPRGPRGYNHPSTTGPTQGDSSAPRAPKRRQHPYVFHRGPSNVAYLSLPDGEPIKLPDYRKPMDIVEMEKSVHTWRQAGQKLAREIDHQLTQLPKLFYEYEAAAREVRVAESRRKICEAHLEKAKCGTLGMDYTEDDTETKS